MAEVTPVAIDVLSPVKRNLLANFAGIGWSGLVTLALVPFYVRYLGVEAYGLVGFQLTLQWMVVLLDFGLATTVNRELARLTASNVSPHDARTVVRTAEVLYWTMAATIAIAMVLAAPLLATRWFSPHDLSVAVLTTSLRFIGLATALRFPYALYSAALYGLQRHTVLNAITSAGTTLRAAGTVVLIGLVARDVRLLFAWEAFAALIVAAALFVALTRALPGEKKSSRFDVSVLSAVAGFTAGVGAIGILSTMTMQVDKLVVSKVLPLRTFGYYTIATTLCSTVLAVVSPVFLTVFPRFSQLVARGDGDELAATYHRSAQVLAAVLLPIVAVLSFFGEEIVRLWTRDAAAAAETRWLIVLLVGGAALNALMSVPYALQLASGWTTPALLTNGFGVLVLVPATILATERFGSVGAAACWFSFHLCAFLFGMTITHMRLLRGHRRRWLWRAVLVPAATSLGVCAAGRLVITNGSTVAIVLIIGAVAAAALVLTAIVTPAIREWLAAAARRNSSPAERSATR